MSETTAKVMKKKSAPAAKGKVHRMMFEKADNGMISSASHESDDGSPYGQESKMVHPSMAHAVKHMKATMGGCFPGKDGGEGGDSEGPED